MNIFNHFLNIGVWDIEGLFMSINKFKICKLGEDAVKELLKRSILARNPDKQERNRIHGISRI